MMEKPPPSESAAADDDDDDTKMAAYEPSRGVAPAHVSTAAPRPTMMTDAASMQLDQDDQMLDTGEDVQLKKPGKKVKAKAKSPPKKRAAKKGKKPNRKPRDMPSRPLSAYNIFFREERIRWLERREVEEAKGDKSSGNKSVGGKSKLFIDMGKAIGSRWQVLSGDERAKYHRLADGDANRYRLEMEAYNDRVMREKNPDLHSQQQQQPRSDRSSVFGAAALPPIPSPSQVSSTTQHMGTEWNRKAAVASQQGVPLTGLHAYLQGDFSAPHHPHHQLDTASLEEQHLLRQLLGTQGATHQQPPDLGHQWLGSPLLGQHRHLPDLQLLDTLSGQSLRQQLQDIQQQQQQQAPHVSMGSLPGRAFDEQLRSLMEENSRRMLVQQQQQQQQQQQFGVDSNFPQLDAQLAHLSLYRGALDPRLSHHNSHRSLPPYDHMHIPQPPSQFDQALAPRSQPPLQGVPSAAGAPSELSTPLSDTVLRIGQEVTGGLSYAPFFARARHSQEQSQHSGSNPDGTKGPPGPSDDLRDGSFPGGLP